MLIGIINCLSGTLFLIGFFPPLLFCFNLYKIPLIKLDLTDKSAVESLIEGKSNYMVGLQSDKVTLTPLEQAIKGKSEKPALTSISAGFSVEGV